MKYIVTFAGAVGSSKTPIANYLSGTFNLPVFNTDVIRSEVIEDKLTLDQIEFEKRRDERLAKMIKRGVSFILDASIDRIWGKYGNKVREADYKLFLISLDLSRELLAKLYQVKGYNESMGRLDQLIDEHEKFLAENASLVNVKIDDQGFTDRLLIAETAFGQWLDRVK